jgi:BMFP domain-containing protein YqiC
VQVLLKTDVKCNNLLQECKELEQKVELGDTEAESRLFKVR